MNARDNTNSPAINAVHSALLAAIGALCVDDLAKQLGVTKKEAGAQLKALHKLAMIEAEAGKGGVPFYRLIAEPAQSDPIPTKTYGPEFIEELAAEIEGGSEGGETDISDDLRAEIRENCGQPYVSMDETLELLGYVSDYMPWESLRPARAVRAMDQLIDAQQAHIAELQAQVDALTADVVKTRNLLESERRITIATNIDLSKILHHLGTDPNYNAPHEAIAAINELKKDQSCLASAPAPAGYIVMATKRDPFRTSSQDRAKVIAESAVRNGAKEASVFALVPAGKARRGVEWKLA